MLRGKKMMEPNEETQNRKQIPTNVYSALTYATNSFKQPKTRLQKVWKFIRGLFPCTFGTINSLAEATLITQQKEAEERVQSDRIILEELNKHSIILNQQLQNKYTEDEKNEDDPSYG